MQKNRTHYLMIAFATVLIHSCKIADISQVTSLEKNKSEAIAEQKLAEVISSQGFDVMASKNTYTFTATDDWPGLFGKMVKIWPDEKTTLKFKHNFNTFDGSALFLNGKKKGDLIGIQSWNYYEKENESSEIECYTLEEKKSLSFAMVIFHYFLELPYRINQAPIKRYYGQQTKNGETYDLVFASWESETSNPDYDQYILWINTKTKLVDYCIYTLRDNKNPITRKKYGSIAYQNYRNIDGFMIPFNMPVMLDDDVIKKEFLTNYFHQFTIHDFTFSEFDESELYPISNIEKQFDTK